MKKNVSGLVISFRSLFFAQKFSWPAVFFAGIADLSAVAVCFELTHSRAAGGIGALICILVGARYGLLSALGTVILCDLTTGLAFYFLQDSISYRIDLFLGGSIYLCAGGLAGSARNLIVLLRSEIATRKKIETELTQYKDHLEELVAQRTRELETANEYLKQSEKMDALGQLTGGITHDFNNMLFVIIGNCRIIQRDLCPGNPDLEKFIAPIFKTATDVGVLIAQLLSFSRKEEQKLTEVSIHESISGAVNILRHSIGKRITIECKFCPDAPVVLGNNSSLQSVLLNLGINARDAMPNGGTLVFETTSIALDEKYIKVHPGNVKPGRYVLILVSDSGTGMDEDLQKRIFEPFFTTKEKGKGTGMGLAICYSTIKNHNGAIEVYSQKGHGSTFKIYLPMAENSTGSPVQADSRIITGSGNILLIDDDEAIRTVSSEMLNSIGYSTTACGSAEEALDIYRQDPRKFAAVILDVNLPRMDGFTCLTKLKAMNPQACIIMASGFRYHGEYQKIIAEQSRAFLQKPFDRFRLSIVLHDAIANSCAI